MFRPNMPLRDIPDELDNNFLTLATETRSPASNSDQLRVQIIILFDRLSTIPKTPLVLPKPCNYVHDILILEEDLAQEHATIANLNRMMTFMDPQARLQPQPTKILDSDKYDGN